jgi:hypothetical protein
MRPARIVGAPKMIATSAAVTAPYIQLLSLLATTQ